MTRAKKDISGNSPGPAERVAAIRAAAAKAQDSSVGAYFLLVSPKERGGRRFVRLKARSVLAWFQRAWRAAQRGEEWGDDLHGRVYGLGMLFDAIEEKGLDCPATERELIPLLEAHIYFEKDLEAEPHFVHVQTDDEKEDLEYFFFDDSFLKSPGAIDRLPPAGVEEAGSEEGESYSGFLLALGKRGE